MATRQRTSRRQLAHGFGDRASAEQPGALIQRHNNVNATINSTWQHRRLGTLLCFVKSFLEDSEGSAGDVAFEAAADFSCGFAFGGSAFDVGFGGWIMALPT